MNVCRLRKVADIAAIPMFLLLIAHLWNKPDRTHIEHVLLLFAIVGFMADVTFVAEFLLYNRKC